MDNISMSTLPKTFILDLDGTIVKHNGYLVDGHDSILPGVNEFFNSLQPDDKVIILTARKKEYAKSTIDFLKQNNIRYDELLFEMPVGERILINDRKPSGIDMSIAINLDRNLFKIPRITRER